MNIITIQQECKNKSLKKIQQARPMPKENEVLVEVAYAGVNRPDIAQRFGRYAPPTGASSILGLEVSGTITEVGSAVQRWQIGDWVCALTNGAGYAEYVAVPELQCLPVPEGMSLLQAASLPETLFTVWSNVFMLGGFQPGNSVLVHGACSGIGVIAIQLVNVMGGSVFATAGSASRCQAGESLGAKKVVDRSRDDFAAELSSLCPDGINIILDMVGGDYVNKHIRLAAVGGRIISIAGIGGFRSEVNLWPVMQKRLIITGSTLRSRSDTYKSEIANELLTTVWPLLESGQIKPVIDSQFAFEEAEVAHRRMQTGEHIGKIMLVVNDDLRAT